MATGTGLDILQKNIPDQYIEVGIAEHHAVTLAAGMSCDGLKPVVAIYSTFLQRAFDQLIHDVGCLLYTSPSPRDWMVSRMTSYA